MLHIFKLNGHRLAYDCTGRKAYPLSALALKMIDHIQPPLTESCPSALRYAFAKYDSHDLSEAYAELYELYKNGLLFNDAAVSAPAVTDACTAIAASASAAVQKITSALADGAKSLQVYVTGATVCLASSLHETFDAKAKLRLILDLPLDTLSADDIVSLNAHEDVLWIETVENDFTPVLEAWARGINAVTTDVALTDNMHKDLARLAKEIETSEENGITKEYFPFTTALEPVQGFNGNDPLCAECWARELCGGRCASNPSTCDIQRTLTECAIILAARA